MGEKTVGYVHSIETLGSVDGPGLRFVVFMQGCRMRYQFCHNPDTWNIGGGKEYTADELLDKVGRFKPYWGDKGGITVDGEEPLLQIDFLIELFKKVKEWKMHTTLDTCGEPFTYEKPLFSRSQELVKYTDLLLFDIKHIDNGEHKKLTHWDNENILEMTQYLSKINKPVWIRHILVPGRSNYDEYLIRPDSFIRTLSNVDRVEILPYHTMGKYKWETLGSKYLLEGIEPPAEGRIEGAKRLLRTKEYTKCLTQ